MAKQAETDAAKPKKRSPLRRFVVAPLRAGLLGCGVFLWALGALFAARRDNLFPSRPDEDTIILASLALAVVVTLARGYRGPLRSYLALVGRFAGGLAGAGLVFLVYIVIAKAVVRSPSSDEIGTVLGLPGVVFTILAVAWLYGRRLVDRLRASARARWVTGGVTATLALITAWPLSPRLRCTLGSGDGCVRAARLALDDGDAPRGLSLAERGCSLDSAVACRVAGDGAWGGFGSSTPGSRDRSRAEPFYRSACALGDDGGCESLHVLELHGRCEGQRASACRELAQAYRSGEGVPRDGSAAGRFLRQACLLGDAEACSGGR